MNTIKYSFGETIQFSEPANLNHTDAKFDETHIQKLKNIEVLFWGANGIYSKSRCHDDLVLKAIVNNCVVAAFLLEELLKDIWKIDMLGDSLIRYLSRGLVPLRSMLIDKSRSII